MSGVPLSERAALAWTRWYTRGLPDTVGADRRDELTSDLHEHRAEARDAGVSEGRVSVEIVARVVEGVPADLSWRHAQRSRARSRIMTTDTDRRGYALWLTVLAYLMGGFAALIGLLSGFASLAESSDQGYSLWSFGLFATGATILTGLYLTNRAPRASVALVALGGICFGFMTYWMVLPIFAGAAVAIAALLSIPRVVGPRPAT